MFWTITVENFSWGHYISEWSDTQTINTMTNKSTKNPLLPLHPLPYAQVWPQQRKSMFCTRRKKNLDCDFVFSLPNIFQHVLYFYMYWSASQTLLNTATFKTISFLYHSIAWFSSAVYFHKQKEPKPSTKLLPPQPGGIWISILKLQTVTLEAGWIWHKQIELSAVTLLNKIKFPSGISMAYYIFDYVSQHFTYSPNKSIFKCPQWSAKCDKQQRISHSEVQVKEKSRTNKFFSSWVETEKFSKSYFVVTLRILPVTKRLK